MCAAFWFQWNNLHDDTLTWKRFLHNWIFVRGIHLCPTDPPYKGPALWCFNIFFVVKVNTLLNKQSKFPWFGTRRCSWDVTSYLWICIIILYLVSLSACVPGTYICAYVSVYACVLPTYVCTHIHELCTCICLMLSHAGAVCVCACVCVLPSEMECVLFYSRKITHRANVICCTMYPTLNKFYLILSYIILSYCNGVKDTIYEELPGEVRIDILRVLCHASCRHFESGEEDWYKNDQIVDSYIFTISKLTQFYHHSPS